MFRRHVWNRNVVLREPVSRFCFVSELVLRFSNATTQRYYSPSRLLLREAQSTD